jgi:hypothetical protein
MQHSTTVGHAADDTQETTCKAPPENGQQTTDDMRHAPGKMHQTTRRVQQTNNMRHAVDDMQP